MKDIVVFKGTGAYSVMQYFAEKLNAALNEEGLDSEIVDLSELDTIEFEKEVKIKKPKLCIGFNSMHFNYKNTAYYKYFDIKHLAFFVDHPIHHIPIIDLNYDKLFISCNDISRVNYLKNEIKFTNAFPLLLAADKKIQFSKNDKDKDVVFFGTMVDYNELRNSWKSKFSKPINKVLDDALEIGMFNSFMPIHEILNIAMLYNGYQNLNEGDKLKFQLVLLPQIDTYLRFFNRHKFIEKISKQKIDIYGNDIWHKYLHNDNITIHPAVDIETSFDLLRRSKIALNSTMTLVYNGITERVLNSAMSGSVIFSNYSPLLKEIFMDNALLTDIKDMIDIDDKLEEILKSDVKRNSMAENARSIAEKNHTWNNRVLEIKKLI